MQQPAKQNPWYLLATLFGELPIIDGATGYRDGDTERDLQERNRVAWNRWMITHLSQKQREKASASRHSWVAEIEPFSKSELSEIAQAMRERGIPNRFMSDFVERRHQKIDFGRLQFGGEMSLSRRIFPIRADFKESHFDRDIHAHDSLFLDYATFDRCTFGGSVNLNGAEFLEYAPFQNCRFDRYIHFGWATFAGSTDFSESVIHGHADFNLAKFPRGARFNKVRFVDKAIFYDAFFGYASFRNAAFENGADFGYARFERDASFQGAKFSSAAHGPVNEHYQRRDELELERRPDRYWHGASFRRAQFSDAIDFENAAFLASASFNEARFETHPPLFMGSEFHEGMDWRGIKWPLPKTSAIAGNFVDAYACLKREMDKLKRYDDELDFFALELRSRKKLIGQLRGLPITMYGWCSDFGRSIVHPVMGLMATWLALAFPFWWAFGQYKWRDALGVSLANTLAVFGFRRDFVSPSMIDALPEALRVLAGLQTVLGGAFLFLLSMALRNKFRMK